MSPTQHDRIKRVLQLKMGLSSATAPEAEINRDWSAILAWIRADPKRAEQVAIALLQPLLESVQHVFSSPRDRANQKLVERWHKLWSFARSQGELPKMMIHRAVSLLEAANVLAPNSPPTAPPPAQPPPAPPTPAAEEKAPAPAVPNPELREPAQTEPEPPPAAAEPSPGAEPAPEDGPMSTSPTGAWKHLPLPDEPDRHDEFDSRAAPAPDGFRLIGARVRGKKHKHEGSNCDDWFAFGLSGPWTIVAVSDGAGSYRFSRVGARVSCEAAVEHLAAALRDHRLEPRETWSNETFRRDDTGAFAERDVEAVQQALHGAMNRAYFAVEKAAADRDTPDYEKVLGRKLVFNDLSATLLLAVHTVVRYRDADCSFVLACQVGDGMTAALDQQGRLQLLGEADSGAFSGETDFLTSRNKLERDNLCRKTFGFFRPLRALLVMTDGVADDYFPNDPEMLRLNDDLVRQGIVVAGGEPADVAERLRAWLDSYHVRGSFDDRTLVILHREQAP